MEDAREELGTLFGGVPRGRAGKVRAPAKGPLVRVVVERGIDDPDLADGFTYRALDETIQVGDRVSVPLGKGGKATGGLVISLEDPASVPAGMVVKGVLEQSQSRLPAGLIELARWMSKYYCSPLGMVLSTMVPAAVKQQVGRRTERLLDIAPGDHAEKVQALSPAARRAWERLAALAAGSLPAGKRAMVALIEESSALGINALTKAGVLVEVERTSVRAAEVFWREGGSGSVAAESLPTLTDEQQACVTGIGDSLGRFGMHVLRGVTGSGKTEVYLRVIDRALREGKTALVLVPEISLTPQTVERFERRFGTAGVAVLHSGLSAAQRHRQWMMVSSGRAKIVVGARSAVFAPVTGLGVVIVDEEHDASYKQDQAPRYNGRDVAVKRAQIEGCPVVVGSATPALESWHNVKAGKAKLWELTRRVAGGVLPPVEIVDLAMENRLRAMQAPGEKSGPGAGSLQALGPTLESAIDSTLRDGGQVILLLNRRGFANYICCPSRTCGWMLSCEQCDAAMVLHRDKRLPRGGVVVCHHCGSEQRVPTACPSCGKPPLPLGIGTQRVEEELAAKFGASHGLELGVSLLRVDSDTMKSARDYFDVLGRFGRGDVRMMVGTQMIAKGLDFPNVRLVGVVNADTAVWMPDFRAWERTFQLVSQVAGRAGRGSLPGRVIVQTACPDNIAIRLAAQHDYVTFADGELDARRQGGRPPISRMARVVCRDEDDRVAQAAAQTIADAARRVGGRDVEVVGPMPCALARLHNQFRFAVELTAARATDIQGVLWALRRERAVVSDAATAVDVDPISFL